MKCANCGKVPNLTVFWKHYFSCLISVEKFSKKALYLVAVFFPMELSFTWKNRDIFIIQGAESTRNFIENTGHDILELCNISENFWFTHKKSGTSWQDRARIFAIFFLIRINSMQGWTATTKHGVTSTKRLKHARNRFRKNLQLKDNF